MNRDIFRKLLGALLAGALLAACASAPEAPAGDAPPATSLPAVGVTLSGPTVPPPTEPPALALTQPPTEPPAPSATPEGMFGPTVFPPNVNPLTGELLEDAAALDRIPVAIKIANSGDVRPQWGLGAADLVFEAFTEGGITRLTAVYLGRDARQAGSVRSGRLIDLEIPQMYRALLAYSGASVGVNEKMRASPFYERILTPDFGRGAAFWRDANVPVPHNMFTSTEGLRADALSRGVDVGRQDLRGMAFAAAPPAGGEPGMQVVVSYNASYVLWLYQEGLGGRYYRWNDGLAHNDAASGQQLSAANVVVLYAPHICDWSVVEDTFNPNAYWYSIEVQLWSTGPAKVFRDGLAFDATWVRLKAEDMPGFVDADNNPVPLKPGNTWFQVVGLDSPTKVEGGEWDVDPKEPGCVRNPSG